MRSGKKKSLSDCDSGGLCLPATPPRGRGQDYHATRRTAVCVSGARRGDGFVNAETLVLVPDPGLSFCLSLRMVHYELVRQTSTAHRPQLTSDHERANVLSWK